MVSIVSSGFDHCWNFLFRAGGYHRNALQVHVELHRRRALTSEDFDRWVSLWHAAVAARFAGPVADRATIQATRIAGSMQRRLAGRSGSAFETLHRAGAVPPGGRP